MWAQNSLVPFGVPGVTEALRGFPELVFRTNSLRRWTARLSMTGRDSAPNLWCIHWTHLRTAQQHLLNTLVGNEWDNAGMPRRSWLRTCRCRGYSLLGKRYKSAPGRIRTCDQEIRRLLLYPLSYGGAWNIILEGSGCDARRPTPTRCRSRFAKVLPLRYGYTRPRADRFPTGVHTAQRCTRFFDRDIRGQWTHRRAHRSHRGGILRVAGTDSSGYPGSRPDHHIRPPRDACTGGDRRGHRDRVTAAGRVLRAAAEVGRPRRRRLSGSPNCIARRDRVGDLFVHDGASDAL